MLSLAPTASGLYYLSELVEEHTVIAKRFLTRMIYAIIGAQVLLCLIDGFPFKLSVLSIGSHLIYLMNLRRFPFVKLSEPLFVSSCGRILPNLSLCRYWQLIQQFLNSSGPHQPLLLVLTLLRYCAHRSPITIRSSQPPIVYRNRVLLRSLRLAGSILPLRFSVRE